MLSDGYLQKITCFRLCIDEKKEESDAVRGRIYGIALKEPVLFSSYSEVLMKLEKILDEIGFPQAFQQLRSFRREEKETMKQKNEVIQYHSAEDIDVEKGKISTFDIDFATRQHSSLQGKIFDEKGLESAEFDSELELLSFLSRQSG